MKMPAVSFNHLKSTFEFSFLLDKSQLQISFKCRKTDRISLLSGQVVCIWQVVVLDWVVLIVNCWQICRYVHNGSLTNKLCIFRLWDLAKYREQIFFLTLSPAYLLMLMGCHHHPITTQRFLHLMSSLTNHRTGNFITPPDTHLWAFCTTPDTICAPTLGKLRFRLVISTIYWRCKYFFYLRVDYNDASSGFGLWAKTLRGQ